MEILLLLALGLVAYVLFKRSRGEQPSVAGIAGGCLGLGCLGLVLLSVAGIAIVWLLLQALLGLDLSLSELGDGGGGSPDDPFRVPEREV